MEHTIPGPYMVEYELSDTQRASETSNNASMKTETTGFTTQVDEVLQVNINKDSDGKEELDPKMDVEDEGTAHNLYTEGKVVSKNIDDEEETETDKDMKYTSIQRHKKLR